MLPNWMADIPVARTSVPAPASDTVGELVAPL
jgi:hypothetical protein